VAGTDFPPASGRGATATVDWRLLFEQAPGLYLVLDRDLRIVAVSGETVLQLLRERPETRDIPVVILSADATESSRTPLLEAGARDFVSKPIGVQRLLDLVDRFAAERLEPR
jgi:CheY-like chemotaxis protein